MNNLPYRKTKKDYTYYNSDLNKYIGEELPRIMTTINIDLAQFKKSKNILRVAEYKHKNEDIGYQQEQVLIELSKAFDFLNKNNYPIKFECNLIKGDYPFNELSITDYITNTNYEIKDNDVKKFLTLE
jgi:hypothetical protein